MERLFSGPFLRETVKTRNECVLFFLEDRAHFLCQNERKGYDVMNETTARPMELTDTAELMASTDYKDRFKAEYGQVAIRCESSKQCLKMG